MKWFCPRPRCAKEFDVPDRVVSHWHKCTEPYDGEEAERRSKRMPLDREARGVFWRALLDAVGEEETRRR